MLLACLQSKSINEEPYFALEAIVHHISDTYHGSIKMMWFWHSGRLKDECEWIKHEAGVSPCAEATSQSWPSWAYVVLFLDYCQLLLQFRYSL